MMFFHVFIMLVKTFFSHLTQTILTFLTSTHSQYGVAVALFSHAKINRLCVTYFGGTFEIP